MKRPGIKALEVALGRGQVALDSLPAMLKEAQGLHTRAGECSDLILRAKGRIAGAGRLIPPDQGRLRRNFLRDIRGLRRALRRRIAWFSLRLFLRRIRFWMLLVLLLTGTAFAAGWAMKNRDWLAERLTSMPSASSPAQAPSQTSLSGQGQGSAALPAETAPVMPPRGHDNGIGPDASTGGAP